MFANRQASVLSQFFLLLVVVQLKSPVFVDTVTQSQRKTGCADETCRQVAPDSATNLEVDWDVPRTGLIYRAIQGNDRLEPIAQPPYFQ